MTTSQKSASASASFSTAGAAAESSDGSSGFQSLSPRAEAGVAAKRVSASRKANAPGRRRGSGDFMLLNLSGRKEPDGNGRGRAYRLTTCETHGTGTGRCRRGGGNGRRILRREFGRGQVPGVTVPTWTRARLRYPSRGC